MLSRFFNSRTFLIFISVVLGIILFFNANAALIQNTTQTTSAGQSYTATVKNVPVAITYDENSYFISGYVSAVDVSLASYNQISLKQEESSDSRTFKVSSDLRKYGIGTHQVALQVSNLISGVNATANPATMTVVIEKREQKDFAVTPVVDNKLLPAGYTINASNVDTTTVKVTAGSDSIKKIAKIEAVLPSNVDLHSDYSGTVNLIAVDVDGNVLPAIFSKDTVKLTVKMNKPAGTDTSGS